MSKNVFKLLQELSRAGYFMAITQTERNAAKEIESTGLVKLEAHKSGGLIGRLKK